MAFTSMAVKNADDIKITYAALADEAIHSGTLHIHRCSSQTNLRTSGQSFSV
jgi:hypothetical protein